MCWNWPAGPERLGLLKRGGRAAGPLSPEAPDDTDDDGWGGAPLPVVPPAGALRSTAREGAANGPL